MKKAIESAGKKAVAIYDQATWDLGVADALFCIGIAMIFLSAWYRSKIK